MIAVTYDDHLGTDSMVVNRARVSFRKRIELMRPRDVRLLRYLAEHQHWAPFAHPVIAMHIAAPIFVVRQCFKHKVGFIESEVSRRYVDDPPEFYMPLVWRGRPTDKKQGSSAEIIQLVWLGPEETGENIPPGLLVEDLYRTARETYDALIAGGVAPEQARMVLPQAMMTEWFWTGSLAAWARFCGQRMGEDAQAETAEVARQAAAIIEPLFPESWPVLMRRPPPAEAVELERAA